jgi:hypothetical protein
MPIRYLKTHAALEGIVTVEDAEALAPWLQTHKNPKVHLGLCEHMHTAVLQALVYWKPLVVHNAKDPLLASLLASHLTIQPARRATASREGATP